MASSSSSSSSAPQYTGNWKHDVFVCFRGDTRGLFTSHLAGYLHQRKIRVFTDDKLERTEDIDELLSILASSAMSVVIFSKKFAESRWCLNEVAIIAQSMEQFGHRVLPIFYLMNPEDVSEDSGSYSSMIDTIHKPCLEEKRRWMNALKVVANRAGRSSNVINDDYELCKTIVDDVLKILKDMSSRGEFNNLVGMDTRVSKVQQLLPMDTSNSSCIVGLLGMGGLGKTTLAKAWYQILTSPTNRIKHYFVSNVNRSCEALRGVEELVRELYASLLSEGKVCEQDLDVDYRRERLSRLKVVLVLDDVETTQQLEQLLLGEILDPTKLFGPGSIIIITSRNQQVLIQANAKIHTVEGLDSSESLHLFSLHAFKQCSPFDDLMDQSRRVVSYCKGNPLALKVLGGTLFGRNKEYWGSFISGLHNIDPEIHEVLSKSYYALKGEEQRLFMDVACFVRGTSKTKLIKYLATTYVSAPSILEDLIGKSLIFCVPSQDREMIEVHDLLKEMAWNIVNAEPNPSWLKKPSDIRKLFAVPERRQAIESMILDLSKASKMCLGADAFDCMNSLRLLDVFFPFGAAKIQLPDDGLNMLPNELRWLEWIGFPSKCLPATFCPEKLVVLSLRHSKIESCWRGVQQPKLVHLIALNLSYCLNLTAVPDLSGCKKLELLRLKGCKSLVELPSHVQDLDTLIEVDLSECLNLMHLPAKLNSKCLKYVRLAKCPKVTICPEITNSGDLEVLDLDGTPVQELPSAIHKVKNGSLRLCGKYITSFPRISRSLKHFQLSHTTMRALDELLPKFNQLELVGNSQLVIFPNNIWDMVRKELWVEGSPLIASLPDISSPGYDLTGVYLVNCGNLKSLPSGISNLKCLRVIHYIRTAIESLPSSIHLLDQLRVLNLSFGESLESIPDNIHKLAKLFQLSLRGCVKIQSLPELPPNLEVFCVSGCKSLQALPSNTMKLNLPLLRFENCPQLDSKLPDQIVAGFPNCAVMSLRVKSSYTYPGREIPKWFGDQETEDAAIALQQLPENCKKLKGVAFAVVFSVDTSSIPDGYSALVDMKCDGRITDHGAAGKVVASWDCMVGSCIHVPPGRIQDHVFVWLDVKGEPMEVTEEAWYVKYSGHKVSFRFYSHVRSGTTSSFRIKKCGARLIF
ncbi:Disease resistance-like protein DSC1 [Linum perenne]